MLIKRINRVPIVYLSLGAVLFVVSTGGKKR